MKHTNWRDVRWNFDTLFFGSRRFFDASLFFDASSWVLKKEKHASRTVEVHYRLSHSLPEWCRSYQSAAGCRLWFKEWLVSRVVHELRNEKIMKIQKSANVLLNRTPKNYGRQACQGSFAKLHLPRSAGGTKKAKNTRSLQLCGDGKREEIWENTWVHDHRQRTGSNSLSRSNSLSFLGPKPQEFDLDEIHLLPECRRAPEARRNFWHPRAMSFTRTRRGKGSKKQNHERSNLTTLVEARRGRRGYRSSPKDL